MSLVQRHIIIVWHNDESTLSILAADTVGDAKPLPKPILICQNAMSQRLIRLMLPGALLLTWFNLNPGMDK